MKRILWEKNGLRLVVTSESWNVEYLASRGKTCSWRVSGYHSTLNGALHDLWEEVLKGTLLERPRTILKRASKPHDEALNGSEGRTTKGLDEWVDDGIDGGSMGDGLSLTLGEAYRKAEQEIRELVGALKPEILNNISAKDEKRIREESEGGL